MSLQPVDENQDTIGLNQRKKTILLLHGAWRVTSRSIKDQLSFCTIMNTQTSRRNCNLSILFSPKRRVLLVMDQNNFMQEERIQRTQKIALSTSLEVRIQMTSLNLPLTLPCEVGAAEESRRTCCCRHI